MGWLLLFPAILIGSAGVAAFGFVRFSTLRVSSAGVEIRNYPQAARVIPLARVERFVATEPSGSFKSLRPETGALVLTDGTRVPVRKLHDPEAGYGVDALNDRLTALREAGTR